MIVLKNVLLHILKGLMKMYKNENVYKKDTICTRNMTILMKMIDNHDSCRIYKKIDIPG